MYGHVNIVYIMYLWVIFTFHYQYSLAESLFASNRGSKSPQAHKWYILSSTLCSGLQTTWLKMQSGIKVLLPLLVFTRPVPYWLLLWPLIYVHANRCMPILARPKIPSSYLLVSCCTWFLLRWNKFSTRSVATLCWFLMVDTLTKSIEFSYVLKFMV